MKLKHGPQQGYDVSWNQMVWTTRTWETMCV